MALIYINIYWIMEYYSDSDLKRKKTLILVIIWMTLKTFTPSETASYKMTNVALSRPYKYIWRKMEWRLLGQEKGRNGKLVFNGQSFSVGRWKGSGGGWGGRAVLSATDCPLKGGRRCQRWAREHSTTVRVSWERKQGLLLQIRLPGSVWSLTSTYGNSAARRAAGLSGACSSLLSSFCWEVWSVSSPLPHQTMATMWGRDCVH